MFSMPIMLKMAHQMSITYQRRRFKGRKTFIRISGVKIVYVKLNGN